MYDESCRIYNWHIPSQQVIYIIFWIKHTYEIPKLKKKLLKTFRKGLGAIRAKIGPTSDVDKIFSKMYSQYVLFRNKYS
jgi:hypothetical protein